MDGPRLAVEIVIGTQNRTSEPSKTMRSPEDYTIKVKRSIPFTPATHFAASALRLSFLPYFSFRRLFIKPTHFHNFEHSFALKLLLERLQGMINIIKSN
jgi:hypothetical protein